MIPIAVLLTTLLIAILVRQFNESYFHTFAYSQTTGAAITNTAITAPNDGILSLSGTTGYLMPQKCQIYDGFATGATLTRARLNTPSLRAVSLPSIVPINASATVPSPANFWRMDQNPIPIPTVDTVSVEATDTAIDTITAVLVAMFKYKPIPQGAVYRVRATATITGVINVWASGAMTLDQTLPQGQYLVVGMDLVAANVIAGRLIFAGTGWRPGVVARNAVGSIAPPLWTDGRLGCYGAFENANLPNLEILLGGGGANAAQEVFLDLIRIGDVGTQQ